MKKKICVLTAHDAYEVNEEENRINKILNEHPKSTVSISTCFNPITHKVETKFLLTEIED